MPGEKSKSSGEYGEKIVHELLKIMGWECPVSNIDIPCYLGDKHRKSESNRLNHGIDNIFQYSCPLRYGIQQNIVISVKNSKDYKNGTQTRFKSFLKDIGFALECFSSNSEFQTNLLDDSINKILNWGIIFWFAYEELPNQSVIDLIGDFNNTDDLQYDTVFLVDNRVANFLFSSYTFANSLYPNHTIEYYYPSTTFNLENPYRETSGYILPIQYINSSVLSFKITNSTESILVITMLENFDEEILRRIIGLAQTFTQNWASKTIIAFPDYHEQQHSSKVNKVKLKFSDKNFISKLIIRSYPELNIKSLEEDQNV